ncbi:MULTISPECIES: hypothetical protein [Pseudanabaena]|uniref:hypothetical protein n=1 Tax=Pseudanabaena TaxID=1152 RepID=UPI00247931D8|nr:MULTISPECIES: hypothetical protein [Pseudanabaena]MEA5489862.1 hypothetical protein [Pseudanabaena sp. CCNP1317]WGS74152.1 hypothetical protein OA858_09040 [Pseudanabaena galeata CCNP1313]
MTNSNSLIYPTIDLFLYDLAEGLGQVDNNIAQISKNFWQRIYGDKLSNAQLKTFSQTELEPSDYIQLLGAKRSEPFEGTLDDGYYYPVKLGNTYALQVNCSIDKLDKNTRNFAPCDIKNFLQIKQNILSHLHNQNNETSDNYLGQTWFVSAKLTSATQDPTETIEIAKQIYSQLQIFEQSNWDKDIQVTEAQLLGASCFELWQLPSDRRGDIKQSKHLVICLFPSEFPIDREKISDLYRNLIRLFGYRHKIIWAYTCSRKNKNTLKEEILKHTQPEISDEIDLATLQTALKFNLDSMTLYAKELIKLESQKNTIETNLKNYQNEIKELIKLESQKNTVETNLKNYQNEIKQFEGIKPNIDQPLFNKFTAIVTDKYIDQIAADLASLSPEQKFLENSVRKIEGIINIEQARSDRKLNQTIFAIGTGLGTSQVAAGVIVAQFPSKADYHPAVYIGSVFVVSIFVGLIFGGGVICWFKRSRNSKKF